MISSDVHVQDQLKTPTRLVEEISASINSLKTTNTTEPDTNLFDILSTSPPTTTTTDDIINKTNSNDPILNHQPCTYNVTISNKPNKLGLTIKKSCSTIIDLYIYIERDLFLK